MALQGRDGGGICADVRGVLGAGFQGRVLGEDEAELPGGDALQLDDRRLGDAVVQHSAGEGGREEAHVYSTSRRRGRRRPRAEPPGSSAACGAARRR